MSKPVIEPTIAPTATSVAKWFPLRILNPAVAAAKVYEVAITGIFHFDSGLYLQKT